MTVKRAVIHADNEVLLDAVEAAEIALEAAGKWIQSSEVRDHNGHPRFTLVFDDADAATVPALQALLTYVTTGGYSAQLESYVDLPDNEKPATSAAAITTALAAALTARNTAQAALQDIGALRTLTKAIPDAYQTLTDTEIDAVTDYPTLERYYSEIREHQLLVQRYLATQGQAETTTNISTAIALGYDVLAQVVLENTQVL